MKVTKLAIMIAMAGGLSAGVASAQTGLRQPSSVVRTGFEYGSYYQTSAQQPASPSDAPVAEPAPVVASAPGCDGVAGPTCAAPASTCNTCGTSGCSDCKECALECEDRCEPWRLFGNYNESNCRGINIRGWVNAGIMGNHDTPASNFNGPVTFYDRDGEGQLSQLYLIAEKALDPEKCGWQLGGRIDVLYGTDYRFNISRGLTANDDFTAKANSSRFYGLDIPQAYVELGNGNTSVKFGHFYTIIGYEVVTAPDNFFMTHAYTMQYGEPFTHTGALVTHKVNDQLSLLGGITTGWDNFDNVYNSLSFLGGATMTASDGNSKLAYAVSVGQEETVFGTPDGNLDTRYIQSVVYSRKLTDRLDYVFQSDYGSQRDPGNNGGTAEWYGVNQYLFYKLNCCWSAGLRGEWFRDGDGVRVAPAGDYAALGPAVNNNPAGAGGFAGDFYEVAAGLNWKPQSRPNLTVRAETRYDWYNGPNGNPGTGGPGLTGQPYDDGAKNEQLLYGLDFIYAY